MYKSLFITRFLYFKLAIWINLIYGFRAWVPLQLDDIMIFFFKIVICNSCSSMFNWNIFNSIYFLNQFLSIIDFDFALKNLRRLINIFCRLFDYLSIFQVFICRPFNFTSNKDSFRESDQEPQIRRDGEQKVFPK